MKRYMGSYRVDFGKECVETDDLRLAYATYVYHKLIGCDNLRFMEMIEEDFDEEWTKWRVIKRPISHYNIEIKDGEEVE